MVEEAVDTNFYALPVGKAQAFPLDVGSDPIIDINSTGSGFSRINARKVPAQTETHVSLEGACIPLTLPQDPFTAPDLLINRRSQHQRSKYKETRTRLAPQYEWYVENVAASQQHQGLRRSLGKRQYEAISHSYKEYSLRLKGTQYLHENKVANAKGSLYHTTETVQSPCYDVMADVPRKLLLRLLDESCLDYYDEAKENACLRSCVTKLSDNVVVYACGPYRNEVVILVLTLTKSDEGGGGENLCPRECERVDVENRIMELLYVEQQGCLMVRSHFAVSLFRVVSFFS